MNTSPVSIAPGMIVFTLIFKGSAEFRSNVSGKSLHAGFRSPIKSVWTWHSQSRGFRRDHDDPTSWTDDLQDRLCDEDRTSQVDIEESRESSAVASKNGSVKRMIPALLTASCQRTVRPLTVPGDSIPRISIPSPSNSFRTASTMI